MTYPALPSRREPGLLPEQLQTADTATLLLCLTEMTGETSHLDRWGSRVKGPTPELTDFSEEDKAAIRKALCEAIAQMQGQADTGYGFDNVALNDRMFATAAGRTLPPEEQALLLKEMGVSREIHVEWPEEKPQEPVAYEVAIVGAGLSGMAMGIRLKRLGIPGTIYERNQDVGGTWPVNDYPGCGVDIASHSFSTTWTSAGLGWSTTIQVVASTSRAITSRIRLPPSRTGVITTPHRARCSRIYGRWPISMSCASRSSLAPASIRHATTRSSPAGTWRSTHRRAASANPWMCW